MSYIVYEGLDFAGKSTLANAHAKHTKAKQVMEPFTGSPSFKALKEKLVSNTLTKDEEIQGYAVARVEAFKQVIHPYLSHSRDVISDRNVVSSMVYQSDDAVSMVEVLEYNRRLLQTYGYNINPDIIFFVDITHETFVKRFNDVEASGRPVDAKDRMFLDKAVFESYRTKYKKALKYLEETSDTVVHILSEDQHNVETILKLQKSSKCAITKKRNKMTDMQKQAKAAMYFA
ncbi:thymidylate kinase [Aeromonas phage D3]|uniref:dTMP kinase n=2 Tax=Ludhianavirus TaxID=3044751 RepID=A0A514TVK0_9CAUD|nr:thymidylate kinase [Aeromonas phage D3]YP_010668750.1 thymidylate kinase [Aeromonas phage D6]QDJ97000.1 putative thymidylate kinase [Aeromonas phage D3]QDJ97429.1 putative thymidylate kinase [Aeromonas phage D6]QEP52306.1 thymidylate kinase [Aeromonas phage D9]